MTTETQELRDRGDALHERREAALRTIARAVDKMVRSDLELRAILGRLGIRPAYPEAWERISKATTQPYMPDESTPE